MIRDFLARLAWAFVLIVTILAIQAEITDAEYTAIEQEYQQ